MFRVGDKVDKKRGYRFPGKIKAVFKTNKGLTRYVVEMDRYGLLHIFSAKNIKRRGQDDRT